MCGNFLYMCKYNCNTVFCSVQLLTHLIQVPVSAVYNGTEVQLNKGTICISESIDENGIHIWTNVFGLFLLSCLGLEKI